MNEFLNFFDEMRKRKNYRLEIYYSKISDWCIEICLEEKRIVYAQDCDKQLVFAKAQVDFKNWLRDNESGY